VKAGTSGSIDIFASDVTNLRIDINGYFAPMDTGGLSQLRGGALQGSGHAQTGLVNTVKQIPIIRITSFDPRYCLN
jgi:hypothetical protein